ncbi:MAG: response regulator transcription factor [Verrucomicrobia bacterium]|nr:response regulator transcription factor [Verrucomicrobiota bacterium]
MTGAMPCTVSIVEDDPVVRESLCGLVQQFMGVKCLSSFGSAEEALEQLPRQKPNLVLMDINLPKMSGIECVSLLKQRCPEVQVLMLTVYEKPDAVFQALRAGASGYLVKRSVSKNLAAAIQDVLTGGSPMSSHIARRVVQYFHHLGPASDDLLKLSGREREILELLANGELYKEIADKLGISITTVRSHIQHIYEKLHVHTRTEAVAKFLKP